MPRSALIALFLLPAGCVAMLGAASFGTSADLAVLALYAALFIPYALVALRARDLPVTRHTVLAIAGCALLARVVLAFGEPLLSDDVFRYVWDGRVQLAGINPYVYAPSAPELERVRDAVLWPKINHADVPTIYPPGAQVVFAFNALLGGGTTLLRLILVALEALMVFAAWQILARAKHPLSPSRRIEALVLYALNPLVIVEIGYSGHLDVLAWGPLTLALLAARPWAKGRALGWAATAGALLAASTAAKLLGVILVPLLVLAPRNARRLSWGDLFAQRATFLVAFAITLGALFAPYASAGGKMFTGFGTYATHWRGNDGAFRAGFRLGERTILRGAGVPEDELDDSKVLIQLPQYDELALKWGITRQFGDELVPATTFASDQFAQTLAKLTAALVMGLTLLWALVVTRAPLPGALLLLGVLYVVAPTVHPWYVAWLVPLAALTRNRAGILFSFTVLTSYWAWWSYRAGGPWFVPAWVATIEFGSVVALAWWDSPGRRPRRSTRRPSPRPAASASEEE